MYTVQSKINFRSFVKISVRIDHQISIYQPGSKDALEIKVKLTLTHMLAGEVIQKTDRLSLCSGNHICGCCIHVYITMIESQLTTLLHSSLSLSLSVSSWHCVVEDSWITARKQFPLSSTLPSPPCSHIKPDLQKLTAGPLQACVAVLANGKKRQCRREMVIGTQQLH